MHIPGAVLLLRKFREFGIYVQGLLTNFRASVGILFILCNVLMNMFIHGFTIFSIRSNKRAT